MESLDDLFNRFQSDKGSSYGTAHNYSFIYERIFAPLRNEPLNILEMGLCVGGPELVEMNAGVNRTTTSVPSINAWLEYFPRAQLYGFDISDFSKFQTDRFTFIRGDMGNVEDLDDLSAQSDSFDIIIDDASHASFHQQLGFLTLFPKLTNGGVYVIEDVHWQPRAYESTLPSCPKTLDLFCAYLKTDTFEWRVPDLEGGGFLRRVRDTLRSRPKPASTQPNGSGHPIQQSDWERIAADVDHVMVVTRGIGNKVVFVWKKMNP